MLYALAPAATPDPGFEVPGHGWTVNFTSLCGLLPLATLPACPRPAPAMRRPPPPLLVADQLVPCPLSLHQTLPPSPAPSPPRRLLDQGGAAPRGHRGAAGQPGGHHGGAPGALPCNRGSGAGGLPSCREPMLRGPWRGSGALGRQSLPRLMTRRPHPLPPPTPRTGCCTPAGWTPPRCTCPPSGWSRCSRRGWGRCRARGAGTLGRVLGIGGF